MRRKIEACPLLSIVIATRNRVPYAISAIQSILEIPDQRLELVVQDNSDSRELELYIHANIQDGRLRYRYTPPPFSMIDNFNAAVELARGEYLCMIGDDDGVNPEIMQAAEWAKANDWDALTSRIIIGYLWPNTGITSTYFAKNLDRGALNINDFSCDIFEVDVRYEVIRLLNNGGIYYQYFHLPKFYHGVVHRRCLDEIYCRIGTYFKGLSPDIFSVLAISEVANRVMYLDYPLIIAGTCPGSGSTYGKLKKFSRRLEDTFLLRDMGEYDWCELVPRVYSAETIWVDSGIASLRAMGREDLVQELNLPKLAAYCIGTNLSFVGPVLRDMFRGMQVMGKNPIVGGIQFLWSLLTGPGMMLIKRVWNRFQMIMGIKEIHRINGLKNMVETTHVLTSYLKQKGCSLSNCARRGTVNVLGGK